MKNSNPRVALVILDGFGLGPQYKGNAAIQAQMPYYQSLLQTYPQAKLSTSGSSVGLPDGQMGNSEVGHLNIGAGRVILQNLSEINRSIHDGDFFQNSIIQDLLTQIKTSNGVLHLVGLASHGGVHSIMEHLVALVKFAGNASLRQVYIHALLDGRDTEMKIALRDMEELENTLTSLGIGKIVSLSGRFYGMDRDNNWDRTKLFYDAIAFRHGLRFDTALQAIRDAYDRGETDEFLTPCLVEKAGENHSIRPEDGIVFFNFRPDRMRQIVQAFGDPQFSKFPVLPFQLPIVTLTEYHRDYTYPIAFPPPIIHNTLGEVLSHNHISQLRAAETEKYAHVTFFFNSMQEEPYPLEERILVPSLKVPSYDQAPEMKARELTDLVISFLSKRDTSFLLLNYANPDMVGHSGSLPAAIKALEVLDTCLQSLIPFLQKQGFDVLLTADHGNVEYMLYEDGSPAKNHTTFPVPLLFIPHASSIDNKAVIDDGILADLAPTILKLFDLPQPSDMTGKSLIRST